MIAPRLSLVTLGVADVARATAFYEALGWPLSSYSVAGEVSFFATQGALLGLWRRDALVRDSGVAPGAPGGVTVAINLESREAVDAAFADAERAGAAIVKAPVATEWGGYSGYFADLDGHLW